MLASWESLKAALAESYPLGTAVSFFANRRWTFNHRGKVTHSMIKFGMMHGFGYTLNLVIIYVGYDVLGFPHQLVQLFAVCFLAAMFFVMSKFIVFSKVEE